MILFRLHRGLLADAMETLRTFDTFDEFKVYLSDVCTSLGIQRFNDFYINLYNVNGSHFKLDFGEDTRIDWKNTFIVGFGKRCVLGFLSIV